MRNVLTSPEKSDGGANFLIVISVTKFIDLVLSHKKSGGGTGKSGTFTFEGVLLKFWACALFQRA